MTDEVENLIAALADERLRREAVRKLAWLGDARAARPLIDTIRQDDHPKLLEPASDALKKMGSAAVEPLVDALHDESSHVREFAADVLGEIQDKRAIRPLIQVLQSDSSSIVRQVAASALGKLGSGESIEALIAALQDPNKFVRRAAVEALGQIGDEQAIEPLHRLLNDEEEVRSAANDSLAKIKQRRK